MGFFTGCGRVIIVILNMILVVVSLAMVAAGIILRHLSENAFIKTLETELKTALKSAGSKTGFLTDQDVDALNLNEIFATASICLIVIGTFFLVISFCGCCGACYKVQCLLVLYATIIGVLLLAQIIFVILMYASAVVRDMVKTELKSSLKNYKGIEGKNIESLLWNAAMIEFQCCGVNNYRDFNTSAPNWVNPISYPKGSNNNVSLETPLACCVQTFLNETDVSCASSPSSTSNNMNKGCFQTIWDKAFDNPLILGLALGAAFLIQLLLIVFSIMMYRENKKTKVHSS